MIVLEWFESYNLTSESIEILTDRATRKKHKCKTNKGNKSIMQTTNDQVNIVNKLAKYVTRMKAQLCTSAE